MRKIPIFLWVAFLLAMGCEHAGNVQDGDTWETVDQPPVDSMDSLFDDMGVDVPDVPVDDPYVEDVLPDGCLPEECNYLDDDCDGVADNGFDLLADVSNCGACGFACSNAHATPICSEGLCLVGTCETGWNDVNGNPYDGCEYECTRTVFTESDTDGTCSNGIDDDCDGRVDDDDLDCSPCVPEYCNGSDDDCDTLTDEDFDFRSDPLNCGECFFICPARPHAEPTCVLGECDIDCEVGWENTDLIDGNGCESECVSTPDPSEYSCDGVDNDCDGEVDEEYVPYTCGYGACIANSLCIDGGEVCEPLDPLSDDDLLCDNIDNDCDGSVDEEYVPVACHGACAVGATCVAGTENCAPPAESVDTTCDGLDGDCDMEADEDYVPYTCGIGACVTTSYCIAGSEDCAPLTPPSTTDTLCNGIDEDCSGIADEDYVTYTCGSGVCVRDSVCSGGSSSCTVGSPTGDDSDCDGLDDDCDGSRDEHYVSTYVCGTGACQRNSVCSGGVESCTVGSPTGGDTDCDAIDDDCDGSRDEHYVSYQCGSGACIANSTCISGTASCSPGAPTGGDTDCDLIDDDCDGWADEHYASHTCGLGICLRNSVCVTGSESCTPGAAGTETCNNLDDDCDGGVDDGTPVALCGAIAHGTPQCSSGACSISSCNTGYYNLDLVFSNGCECGWDSYEPNGSACASPYNLGELVDSSASAPISVTGNIVPAGDVDWYAVTMTDDSDSLEDEFEAEVWFQTNPGGLAFDVYRGGCGTALCSAVPDCFNWYTDFRASVSGEIRGENDCRTAVTNGYNMCTNNSATFYIRVYRVSGTTTCSNYTLRISNNNPSGSGSCSHL